MGFGAIFGAISKSASKAVPALKSASTKVADGAKSLFSGLGGAAAKSGDDVAISTAGKLGLNGAAKSADDVAGAGAKAATGTGTKAIANSADDVAGAGAKGAAGSADDVAKKAAENKQLLDELPFAGVDDLASVGAKGADDVAGAGAKGAAGAADDVAGAAAKGGANLDELKKLGFSPTQAANIQKSGLTLEQAKQLQTAGVKFAPKTFGEILKSPTTITNAAISVGLGGAVAYYGAKAGEQSAQSEAGAAGQGVASTGTTDPYASTGSYGIPGSYTAY